MKHVLIIGATSGIGAELATLYAKAGCIVGITGRRSELLAAFLEPEKNSNTSTRRRFTSCFDITGPNNREKLFALITEMGGLDLLIYNAGIGIVTTVPERQSEEQTLHTNVTAFLDVMLLGFELFSAQKSGHLAATSSIASIRGNAAAPAYSASKAFMSTYLEGLFLVCRKLRKRGIVIDVSDIQPGFVKTKMSQGEMRFWEAPVEKAAKQIFTALEKKRFRIYVTKRWRIIAWLLRLIPGALYRAVAGRAK